MNILSRQAAAAAKRGAARGSVQYSIDARGRIQYGERKNNQANQRRVKRVL